VIDMLKTGTVVVSEAGRDKGRLMVVLETDENCVRLCDGKVHPLSNPKRKNPKHITMTELSLGETDMKSDRALIRALARLKER